jgi:hypothetical protein
MTNDALPAHLEAIGRQLTAAARDLACAATPIAATRTAARSGQHHGAGRDCHRGRTRGRCDDRYVAGVCRDPPPGRVGVGEDQPHVVAL